jgi:hypothetical protein
MGEVKLENVSTVALDTAALIYYVEVSLSKECQSEFVRGFSNQRRHQR